jgi:hypothetical protein
MAIRFLIGLAAILALGWIWHGPLGKGEALIAELENRARTAVAATELPGIEVRLARHPLSRAATLSGPANDFQREGMGNEKGLNGYVRDVGGISRVAWADRPGDAGLPLLAETLIQVALAYLIGLGVGRLLFGRRRKHGYL